MFTGADPTHTTSPVVRQLRVALAQHGLSEGVNAEAAVGLWYTELCRRVGQLVLLAAKRPDRTSRHASPDDTRELAAARSPECAGIVRQALTSVVDEINSRHQTVLRNLTPHPVTVHTAQAVIDIPPSGEVARCAEGDVDDHSCSTAVFVGGHSVTVITDRTLPLVIGLPDTAPDVLLIVSRLVALAAPQRNDLVFPYSPVRDRTGRIVGCRFLAYPPRTS